MRTEYDIARCAYRLTEAKLFAANKDYVRTQIIYCLLQVRYLKFPKASLPCHRGLTLTVGGFPRYVAHNRGDFATGRPTR